MQFFENLQLLKNLQISSIFFNKFVRIGVKLEYKSTHACIYGENGFAGSLKSGSEFSGRSDARLVSILTVDKKISGTILSRIKYNNEVVKFKLPYTF